MRIGIKLTLVISVLVIISIAITGITGYFIAKQSIEERVREQLKSVSILKENQFHGFMERRLLDLESVAQERQVADLFLELESLDPGELEFGNKTSLLREILEERLAHKNDFFEFFILDLEGKIVISTRRDQEKKFKSNEPYFNEGKQKGFIQYFYYDISLQKPAMTISFPIRETTSFPVKDNEGKVIGILAGRIDVRKISEFMTERSGLGETGETYLVNNFNMAVTDLRGEEGSALSKLIHTNGVESCLKGNEGFDYYKNYKKTTVSGYYLWIQESEICMLTEISLAEALLPVTKLGLFILLFSLGTVFLIIILGFFLSKTITNPLLKLRNAAVDIGKGKLDTHIDISTKDEVGELAAALTGMVTDLEKSKRQLEYHSKTLEKEVGDRTLYLKEKLNELEETKHAVLNILEDTDQTNKDLTTARQELQKKVQELKLVDKKKDEFLSVTAHELKTPLTSIKGFVELLKNDKIMKDKEQRNKYFDIIIQDTVRLGKLITDILDLSRLDLGTMKFYFEKTTADEIMGELKNLVDLSITTKNLESQYLVSKDMPEFYTDKSRLLQVISNLVNNAVKYTEKGSIKIEAFIQDKFIHFKVTDTGTGIPKIEHTKLFRRFYQVDSSYTRKVGGSGLGLSICKGIVEALGGKIWLKSVVGKGSTFEFKIKYLGHSPKIEDTKADENKS